MGVHYTGESVDAPSDLDWGGCGTMVPISMWRDIWEIATELAIMMI